MQLDPSMPNHVRLDNQYMFFNFTPENAEYVKTISPLTIPAFHIFIHDVSNDAIKDSIDNLLRYCVSAAINTFRPLTISVYVPMRHSGLRLWVDKFLTADYRKLINWVYVDNHFVLPMLKMGAMASGRPSLSSDELLQRLIVDYQAIHDGNQLMSVSCESPKYMTIPIATFIIKPDDDWVSAGKPGYQ